MFLICKATGVNWTFKGLENLLPKFIKFDNLIIECEQEHVNDTTEWETDIIIKDSCSLRLLLFHCFTLIFEHKNKITAESLLTSNF